MTRRRLAAGVFVWALTAGAWPALALDPARHVGEYVHDVWRLADGLPQMSVTGIVQSRDGYLWLGTLDGAVRFDGVRFETINLIHAAGMESLAQGAGRGGAPGAARGSFVTAVGLVGEAGDIRRFSTARAHGAPRRRSVGYSSAPIWAVPNPAQISSLNRR